MNHALLLSEADRWKLAYSYLKFKCGDDSIWREEDLPKLQPFFKYSDKCHGNGNFRAMTQDEKDSFDYYIKCEREYNNELTEKRDSVYYISEYTLIEAFGYEIPSDEDENGNKIFIKIDEDTPLKSTVNITYPCVCVSWIASGYDRLGSSSICAIDYVELKDFKPNE